MTLEDFLQEWQQVTPNYLKNLVNEISSKLHLKSIFPKNNDIKVALK
jgi:predicted SPOUT superfamily RNA methylase MTH1